MIHYHKASNHILQGHYDAAANHLEEAIHRQGNDAQIWKELGKAYHHMEMSKSIHEAFDLAKRSQHAYLEATRLNPIDAESFYGLARETATLEQLDIYVNSGKGTEKYNALPFFQKAIQLRPHGILYHYTLARYLHRHSKTQDLLQIIRNLSRIHPPVISALKKEAFWSAEIREAAIGGMRQALEAGKSPPNTHMALSSLLSDENDWAGAIFHYQQALASPSNDRTAGNFYYLGRLYLENGQFEEAEKSFFKGLSLSLSREKDLEYLYRFYKSKNDTEKFCQFYDNVRQSFDLSVRSDILLAKSLIDSKDYQQAWQILMDLNREEPSAEAYYWMARIAEIEKDWDRLELAIQKATVLDPGNSRYYLIFSRVLQRLKKLKRAEKAADLAIKHAPKPSPALFNHRARIRWNLEHYPNAAKDWEAAIKLEPENASFHALAAEAHIKSGNWSLARDHYQKAVRRDPQNTNYQKKYNELETTHKNLKNIDQAS
jgi:tetratricopeptide (TPR) repeat protein